MTGIPQPASEPYAPGDHVTIYIADDDIDAEYHDQTCIIVERFKITDVEVTDS